MSKETVRRGGTGFLGLLTILFIGLKLTNMIDWSWWWVLSPLWSPFALILVVVLFGVGVVAITHHWGKL